MYRLQRMGKISKKKEGMRELALTKKYLENQSDDCTYYCDNLYNINHFE